jgi:hypothetical protein
MRKIDSDHSQSLKMIPRFRKVSVQICIFCFYIHTYFPKSRSEKHFQVSRMREIDFLHKIPYMGHF